MSAGLAGLTELECGGIRAQCVGCMSPKYDCFIFTVQEAVSSGLAGLTEFVQEAALLTGDEVLLCVYQWFHVFDVLAS